MAAIQAALNREIILNRTSSRWIGVGVFIVLTSLGAFVRIPLPFTPVPITLQTLFVLLSGVFLGSGFGAISQLGYIFLGLAGISIFTGTGSGVPYFCGPTAGYLLGFVASAFCAGRFIKYAQGSRFLVFAVLCLADLVLLGCGVIWLKFLFGYSLGKSLLVGLMPFLPGDVLKALIASGVYLGLRSRIKDIF